ncbi:hypothetical protein IRJ41_001738 [Triplophysa rosa]|uniref:Uncharacterized protein n=1 Tax=Triplophysa rosa TaxID=992332 RepID=A0A9W7WKX3_TRIRA|nr:hypothetical protein IRJ41_001738 [Triplophysa rosa]
MKEDRETEQNGAADPGKRTRLQTPVPSIKCILLEVYHPSVKCAFQSSAQSGLLDSTRLRTADLFLIQMQWEYMESR